MTRRQPSSEMAATYLTSGENTKSTTARRETRQWLTGFFATLSLLGAIPPEDTGCHGGMVTKMLSIGSHGLEAPSGDRESLVFFEAGSCGVKFPSSRSLSYTMIVPSACATRKSEEEDGTHRTAVQGELVMLPYSVG